MVLLVYLAKKNVFTVSVVFPKMQHYLFAAELYSQLPHWIPDFLFWSRFKANIHINATHAKVRRSKAWFPQQLTFVSLELGSVCFYFVLEKLLYLMMYGMEQLFGEMLFRNVCFPVEKLQFYVRKV